MQGDVNWWLWLRSWPSLTPGCPSSSISGHPFRLVCSVSLRSKNGFSLFSCFVGFRLLQVLFSRLLSGLFRFSNSNNSSSRLLFIDVNYFNFCFCLNKNLGCCSVCLQLARLHKSGEWWAEVPKKFCWLAGWHGWNVWCKYVEWTPWDKRTTRPTSPVEPDSPVAALSH